MISSVVSAALAASTFRVTFVTGSARSSIQGLRMAVPARGSPVIHTPSAFVGNARMRAVISGIPVIGRVAGRAVQAEHAGVEGRIGVTVGAGGRESGKLPG